MLRMKEKKKSNGAIFFMEARTFAYSMETSGLVSLIAASFCLSNGAPMVPETHRMQFPVSGSNKSVWWQISHLTGRFSRRTVKDMFSSNCLKGLFATHKKGSFFLPCRALAGKEIGNRDNAHFLSPESNTKRKNEGRVTKENL